MNYLNFKSGRVLIYCTLFFLIRSLIPGISFAQVGSVLSPWKEGFLDIHHINAGKGESAFLILPDGTTLLVDAGDTQRPKPRVTDQKPNADRTPGEWIARYILHMLEGKHEKAIDYVLVTHFHGDHMGEIHEGSKNSKSGGYKLSGITEVAEHIPFIKIVDRGWPDYNWPVPQESADMKNYRQFIKWKTTNSGLIAEQFKTGHNNQFVLLKNPGKYPNFEIRNIAANGHVWTGTGSNVRNHFPPLESIPSSQYPNENMLCTVFRLSYGKFDYFNGADISTATPGTWRDVETPVALVTGPVDVCLANHHAFFDAMSESFLQAVRPRVIIIQAWSPSHPSACVLNRMFSQSVYPGPRDIYTTNVMEETKVVVGTGMDRMKSQQGHIVIRVNPGGENYTIYILDDSVENFKIKAIHGPYTSN